LVGHSDMLMTIRQAQFDMLQRESDIRWYDQQLEALYPQFAAAPAALRREWIDAGLRRAAAYGLQRPEHFQFLCLEQTFAPGSLDTPAFEWAHRILSEPAVSSAERVKRLRQESIRHLLDVEAREEETAQLQAANAAFDALDTPDESDESENDGAGG
jgi:hypothetical protein